jgi:hypothetical protein
MLFQNATKESSCMSSSKGSLPQILSDSPTFRSQSIVPRIIPMVIITQTLQNFEKVLLEKS